MTGFLEKSTLSLALAASAAGFTPAQAQPGPAPDYATMKQTCLDAANKDDSFLTHFVATPVSMGTTGNIGCEAREGKIIGVANMANPRERASFESKFRSYAARDAVAERREESQARAEEARRRADPMRIITEPMRQGAATKSAICGYAAVFGKPCR